MSNLYTDPNLGAEVVTHSENRFCRICQTWKPAKAFVKGNNKNWQCKSCHNLRQNLRRVGLTMDEYITIMEAQGGLCACCRIEPATHLDHCHRKGNFRAILCNGCNAGLGFFQDDLVRLKRAYRYLKNHSEES